jgi:hypothetical protein
MNDRQWTQLRVTVATLTVLGVAVFFIISDGATAWSCIALLGAAAAAVLA